MIRTPRQARAALVYVLQYMRHHATQRRGRLSWDPCSSAASFDGWAAPLPDDADWMRAALAAPRTTMPPTVWLLTTGWRRRGPIGLDEAPAG